ncbi:retrovirus-related pol polyprotein from transposon TNT 1-94 [Tanacetum coccineum]|uniref:Retrovirus-related pol polyprotein from transposon TNT 1-94 n=1 Tax=Tanacetum coccineum TaxID=301880 RepID=A0ABQ5EW85_9ASTR
MFIEQSHDEVYCCLKGGSGNSERKRLAISMVVEGLVELRIGEETLLYGTEGPYILGPRMLVSILTLSPEDRESILFMIEAASVLIDSDILYVVTSHDHYQDAVYEHHEEHLRNDDYAKDYAREQLSHKDERRSSQKAATASRPIKALTVYPPNTPATLVPRVLPTKSQVKINIFALIQLFSDFEKTCNKRITPTGLTEGERGFEQTKACYLTEVIPFFKTLKEHFEGIQKALTKEIKEMKDIFEELEAEVDQNGVDRKHDEIERKNLLIANDNLIADCLSKEVFYVATNSELNVSSFTEMHDAHTSLKARCLELEVELSNLRDKIQKDNHNELVKRFSNLEVNHLNLQLKYQNLKESFGNNTSPPARDVPDFDSVFVIEKMKASIQGKDNAIKKLRMQISQLKETRSEADRTLDFRTLDFQITQLTEKINVLQEQNELFRAENGKIKQHYKELYDSIKITRAKHLEQTTAILTENESLKVQIQNKLSCVNKDHVKLKVLALGKYAIDVEPIPHLNRNNSSLASACRYTKHSQELLEYVIGTCLKALNTRDNKHASTSLPKKKQVTFEEQCAMSKSNTHKPVEQLNCQKTNVSVPPSTGVNSCTNASRSQPRSNTKKNKILPAKSVNMKKVEEHPRKIKSSLKTTNRVDSSISFKHTIINSNSHSVCQTCNKCLISANHDMCVVTYLHSLNASPSVKNVVHKVKQVWKPKQVKQVVQIVLWYLDSGCSKHMTGDRSRLRNFMKKFIGMVRFGNDHFGAIMGYGDYVIGESLISKVYYVEGLGHNLFSVRQFYDSDLEVAFRKHSCYVRDTDGVELIKDLTDYYERVGVFHQKTIPRTPHQNDVDKRQNRTLVEAARTMLIFSKALMFLWAEVVATACYTQNRSLIHTRHCKTPYELVHNKKPDLTFFRVFGALCYPINDSEDLGKLQLTADIGIFIGYAPSRKGYRIYNKRTRWLVPNLVPAAPYVPPANKELEILFQPMFNECMEPPCVERSVSPAPAVQVLVNSAGTPSSTTIDQDAPSPGHSPSSSALQSPSLHQGIAAESAPMKDNHFALVVNNPFINVFALEPSSEASSFWDLISTRKQLATDDLWCLYNFVLSKVKPKNFKSAIIEYCWFQAMQDEIHEFDRLQVWELVPQPDYVMIIALKWIYKVKLDEYGDVLKNKARLVAKGYRQEEGIDFEE